MSVQRSGCAAAALGDAVFVFGGSGRAAAHSDMAAFRRRSRQTASLAAPAAERRGLAGAAPGRHLYAIGGEASGGKADGGAGGGAGAAGHLAPLASVEVYDPSLDAWFAADALPAPAVGAAAAAVAPVVGRAAAEDPAGGCASDGVIWLAGGASRAGLAAAPPAAPPRPGTAPAAPLPRQALSDALLMHDPRQGGWDALPPLPAPTAFASAALLGDRLFVAGGAGPRFDASTIVRVFDTRAGRWAADAAPMATARREHSLVALRGRLHSIGGVGASTTEVYDPVADAWTPGGALPEALRGAAAALLPPAAADGRGSPRSLRGSDDCSSS